MLEVFKSLKVCKLLHKLPATSLELFSRITKVLMPQADFLNHSRKRSHRDQGPPTKFEISYL